MKLHLLLKEGWEHHATGNKQGGETRYLCGLHVWDYDCAPYVTCDVTGTCALPSRLFDFVAAVTLLEENTHVRNEPDIGVYIEGNSRAVVSYKNEYKHDPVARVEIVAPTVDEVMRHYAKLYGNDNTKNWTFPVQPLRISKPSRLTSHLRHRRNQLSAR